MLDMYMLFIKTTYNLQDGSRIHLEEFISLYVHLVRGTVDEKAVTIANVVHGKTLTEPESLSLKSIQKASVYLLYFLSHIHTIKKKYLIRYTCRLSHKSVNKNVLIYNYC